MYYYRFACFLFYSGAQAEPVTLTFTGSGSGTLGGTTFTDKSFTITAIADNDGVGLSRYMEHQSATIMFNGMGIFDFITDTRTWHDRSDKVGFSRSSITESGYDLFSLSGISGTPFNGWNWDSDLGPITAAGRLFQWGPSTIYSAIETTGGILSFDFGRDISSTFQATVGSANDAVPEPGALLLFGTGLAGLAGIVRRKKQ